MNQVSILIQGDLNDFLSSEVLLNPRRVANDITVKCLFESLGVPHPEVGKVLVNDREEDFDYPVQDGDRVEISPGLWKGGVGFPDPACFVLDVHLGKLAAYLRMLGFDSLYTNNAGDEELANLSSRENRILLTRDHGLLMRKIVRFGCILRSSDPRQQVVEIMRRYHLSGAVQPFQRCMRCNDILAAVPKEKIIESLQPDTRQYYQRFWICSGCGQIYWEGSHYQRMNHFIEKIRREADLGKPDESFTPSGEN